MISSARGFGADRGARRRGAWPWRAAFVAMGALTAACGEEAEGSGGGQDASTSGAGASSATSSGTSSSTSTGVLATSSTGSGGCPEPTTCAANLKEVLCQGAVVEACPAGEICLGGACKVGDPCEAVKESKSSIGCEYVTANPDVPLVDGACFAAFVANTWVEPISFLVERGGQSLDVASFARIPSGNGQSLSYAPLPDGKLPPGQIAVLFLSQAVSEGDYLACPAGVTAAVSGQNAALHGTGYLDAFVIRTSAPVVAYDIYPYGGGTSAVASASLLLPTTAWDTNYVAATTNLTGGSLAGLEGFLPTLQLLGAEDGTTVTLSPSQGIQGGGGVASSPAGQPVTYTLDRGQVLQIAQAADLSGTPIQSDKPIGLIGGNQCMNVPDEAAACDAGHQMIPPVRALGREYVAVRYRDRYEGVEESPPWRIMGAVAGTKLSYEPSTPAGAPTELGSGELVTFRAPGPFVVRSQDDDHPFYFAAQMTGCTAYWANNPNDCRGDPETVNVVPAGQFLNNYVFFTDPTYPETNLVFVREKGKDGFADVELDCAGKLGGWQDVGAAGRFQYTRFDLLRGNFEPQGACDNGRREATSAGAFSLTVWGWGSAITGGTPSGGAGGFYSQACSYAYPAGAGVASLSEVVVPPVPK